MSATHALFSSLPGTRELGVKVASDGDAERVGAQECVGQAHPFVASPRDVAFGEVWTTHLAKLAKGTLEDFTVQLQGVPPVLAAFREDLLKLAGR